MDTIVVELEFCGGSAAYNQYLFNTSEEKLKIVLDEIERIEKKSGINRYDTESENYVLVYLYQDNHDLISGNFYDNKEYFFGMRDIDEIYNQIVNFIEKNKLNKDGDGK